MNRVNEALLDVCVKKSLKWDPIEAEKWSIVQCAKNEFLDPEYDPFKMLEYQLMADTIRKKYGIEKEPDDVL
jgi:hypothetical protein